MKLLVTVAHPDDESFGCGSVLARAARAGHETVVLCATRGEAGESRIAYTCVAKLREAELHEAARVLGVSEVRMLGYIDSGMTGPPAPGTLAAADLSTVTAEVQALIDELRPDVVVTLDASDGHRDHAVMRDATLAAVELVAHPPATYLWCLARSSMRRWSEHMRANPGGDAYLALGELGTPDEDITLVVDAEAQLPERWAAMRAHVSQRSPYDDLPDDLQREFLARDRLQLVRGVDLLR